MATGESTATIGTPGDVVSTHTVSTIDGVAVGEREIQRIIISYLPSAGSALTVGTTNRLPADVTGTVGLGAGEEVIGAALGKLVPIRPVMTISAAAYAAGRVIGGELTLTSAMRVPSGTGMLHQLTIVDSANVKPELRCIIFNANPAGTYTNNTTMTINATDYAMICGDITISTSDWITYDNSGTDFAIATKRNLGQMVSANGSQNLFAVFFTIAAPTFTSTTQLSPSFWFVQN